MSRSFYRVFVVGMTFLCIAAFPHRTTAQPRCSLQPKNDKQLQEWVSSFLKKRTSSSSRSKVDAYRVQVVVHVIHNVEPMGDAANISDEQVSSQMTALNADFNALNDDLSSTPPEFQSLIGKMNIEFMLASTSPTGEATNGIVRVLTPKQDWTSNERQSLKALSYWPAENYINIWVCNITDYFGFTQLPLTTLPGGGSNSSDIVDGIIVNYRTFGSNQFGSFDLESPYNLGRTLTHEMGHFLGLRHLWGDESECQGSDFVEDTPPQSGATFGCPVHPEKDCPYDDPQNKMFQNFMDFTDDACMFFFTKEQVARMKIVLENSPRRASLLVPFAAAPSIEFEKIFSPNADGINDFWRWSDPLAYEGCRLSIFNRSGKLVYEKVSYDNSWDGTSSEGRALAEDAYYYVIECSEKSIKGGVRIIR